MNPNSTNSNDSPWNQYKNLWNQTAPYTFPVLAASGAIIPVFYGFQIKSSQQLGLPIPKFKIKQALKNGFKASPTKGGIVGTQMIAQNTIEKLYAKIVNQEGQKEKDIGSMLVSSICVGGISAPALAIFNAQTMGKNAFEALKRMTFKETGAIITRESSFLLSLRISEPLTKVIKNIAGDNQAVEYGTAFTSGVIGSIIGHPADTALTLWQNGKSIHSFSQLMKGSPVKAISVGFFAVCYKLGMESLEKTTSKN